jgi:hypothetical protein
MEAHAMTQDQAIVLAFKVVIIAAEAGAIAFAVTYTILAPWWRTGLGRTLVRLDLYLAAVLVPSILSLFFHFSRLTSHVAAWTDVAIFGLVAAELFRRIPMFIRLHRRKDGTLRPA